MNEREGRLDLPENAIGWGRAGQDMAEAESTPVVPAERDTRSALDRRVGYVTLRWALVAAGGIVGAVAGVVVGKRVDGGYDMSSGIEWPLALAGFALGCLLVGLLPLLMHVKSTLSRGSRCERLADWFFLR
jgi:hypothetical protein